MSYGVISEWVLMCIRYSDRNGSVNDMRYDYFVKTQITPPVAMEAFLGYASSFAQERTFRGEHHNDTARTDCFHVGKPPSLTDSFAITGLAYKSNFRVHGRFSTI